MPGVGTAAAGHRVETAGTHIESVAGLEARPEPERATYVAGVTDAVLFWLWSRQGGWAVTPIADCLRTRTVGLDPLRARIAKPEAQGQSTASLANQALKELCATVPDAPHFVASAAFRGLPDAQRDGYVAGALDGFRLGAAIRADDLTPDWLGRCAKPFNAPGLATDARKAAAGFGDDESAALTVEAAAHLACKGGGPATGDEDGRMDDGILDVSSPAHLVGTNEPTPAGWTPP
jgi:hypothetical protein